MHVSPRREDLSWDDVRLFLALARSRTLSEAGRRLRLDASTMSRRLAALEESLSGTLFERSRSGITPTDAAEPLIPLAEEMEHTMARFTGVAEAFEREVAGNVRIACPPDAAEVLVAPLLPELRERYPKLRVELLAGERPVDMSRREADLAMRTLRPKKGDLIVTKLMSVSWTVAASPSFAKKAGAIRSWRDVPWITVEERMAHTTAGTWYTSNVGELAPALRANLTIQIASVANGLGVALVPSRSLKHFGLVPLKLHRSLRSGLKLPEDDLLLVTHRALRSVPRVKAVWEFLRQHAGTSS